MDKFLSACFFRVYGMLWRAARPLLRRGRPGEGWQERLVPPDWAGKADLWIQAASGGEAHLAVALLRALRDVMGEEPPVRPWRVLVTTWTRQGRDVLEKALPDLCPTSGSAEDADPTASTAFSITVRYAPLDEPALARRAVAQARPGALVLLETELWPGLLMACAEYDVPVHVLNARMTRGSERSYRLIRPVMRRLPVREVYATSAEDAARFRRVLGPDHDRGPVVKVMPNIKLDRAAAMLARPLPPPPWELANSPDGAPAGPVILLASVRRQEEKRLIPMVVRLHRLRPDATLIIAPRHLHRAPAWQEQLQGYGLRAVTVTGIADGAAVTPDRPVIWDRFGELPRLYTAADAVFVGGSLTLGGQNFLEALSAGVIPCVGPSLENFRWALGEDAPPSLAEAGLLHVCPTVEKVERCLLEAAPLTPNQREEVRRRLEAWLAPRTGGAVLAACLAWNMLSAAPCGRVRHDV